ncbi:FAD/NAD(P)-binding protein [Actinoplanes sp. GCM10030250]|uniref:FAD/NAD(P)-binding protein n=1 Tax=Actinoplanes sp. GCM10030250 TaxID=3273376 RepID=UPI00361746B5
MTSTAVRRPAAGSRSHPRPGVVAVVGGGFTGALVIRAVLRRTGWRAVLVSPESRPGRGVAYGAAEPWHVLNSRATSMSVEPGDPLHLVRWSHARGLPVEPATFLSRARYGDYLADEFARTAAAAGDRFRHRLAVATAIRPEGDGFRVRDDGGAEVRADHVVLALGNPPPHRPAGITDAAHRSAEFVADPWAAGALDAVPPDQPVLLIGTGLTAIDVALTLTEGGRDVPVEALSRHGLLPLHHPERPAPGVSLDLPGSPNLRPLLRSLREAAAAGIDWTAIVEEVRREADRLWSGLDSAARERFLRHVARYWEVHRHRMAPPVAARVAALRADGRLRVRSGHLRSVTPHPAGGLCVQVTGEAPRRYGAVVLCTGPGRLPGATGPGRLPGATGQGPLPGATGQGPLPGATGQGPLPGAAGPLLTGLLVGGLVRPGPHGLGVDTDADGRVLDAGGQAQPGLWLAGPLRRGTLWEATAVPEIRDQVDRLAAALPTPNKRQQT